MIRGVPTFKKAPDDDCGCHWSLIVREALAVTKGPDFW